jgi:hypothetical protein
MQYANIDLNNNTYYGLRSQLINKKVDTRTMLLLYI